MKRMSDETAAGIFALVWEVFLYLAIIVKLTYNSQWGFHLLLIDTAVQVTMFIYDTKITKLKKQLKAQQLQDANNKGGNNI